MWPLSRKKSPKQFEKIIDNQSTLQLTVKRLLPTFKPEDIFISTGMDYAELVSKQLPMLPKDNIIGEPDKKDVGPAVALAMTYLADKTGGDEPMVILWSDHLVKQEKKFLNLLKAAEKVIKDEKGKIIFIGQKARFASDNLGWIEFGNSLKRVAGVNLYRFSGFKYKPDKKTAEKYFKDKRHCWNLGYFVSTPNHMLSLFKTFTPQIYDLLQKSIKENHLKKYYTQMPEIHFDHAILEQLDLKSAYVIVEDIGWSDVGAWEALKEALQEKRQDNIIKGKVLLEDSIDNLVYNYDEERLVVGIDLEDLLIVNTDDVLLVTKKTSVSKIKKLVESFKGTENERLT